MRLWYPKKNTQYRMRKIPFILSYSLQLARNSMENQDQENTKWCNRALFTSHSISSELHCNYVWMGPYGISKFPSSRPKPLWLFGRQPCVREDDQLRNSFLRPHAVRRSAGILLSPEMPRLAQHFLQVKNCLLNYSNPKNYWKRVRSKILETRNNWFYINTQLKKMFRWILKIEVWATECFKGN